MTPTQKRNLKKLADYLATGETAKRFSMSIYCANNFDDLPPSKAECGTVACALGHGPLAGVKPRRGEWWGDYASRAFGLYVGDSGWRWCFSDDWVYTDNTPKGAAARINWLLERGVPRDALMQRLGEAPLCYQPA